MISLIMLLLLRLWDLQILEGDKYRKLSEENRLRMIKTPAARGIIYDRNGYPLVQNKPFFSVSLLLDKNKPVNIKELSRLVGIDPSNLEQRIQKHDSPFVPIRLKQGLTFAEVAYIEARRSDFPGLYIETEISREYLYGKTAAHVVGYLGKINPHQLDDNNFRGLPSDAFVGQWGMERLFDNELRGQAGERVVEVNAVGRQLRLIKDIAPLVGSDLRLSIDINVQKAAEEAFGDKSGALIALNPKSGEILSMVSLPSFDPNQFSRGITQKEWNSIIHDRKKPMLNRAIQSQYPPGSIFKIITAIAALEEGIIDPLTKINCTGGLNYGRWTFGCWKKGGHGSVDMHRAIVESCDVYFYEVGRRLGIEKIYKYAVLFGLGKETGVDMPPLKEKKGLIPTADWKKERLKLPWYLGDTFISAIGQGFITMTPLQAAMMIATFANGGYIYKPTFMVGKQEPIQKINLKPETINIISSALAGAVNEPNGTAFNSRSSVVKIAGKTGTAQVVAKGRRVSGEHLKDHAWFVAYAPFENPEIAVAVFVEHGGGGGAVAAPIAKRVIEAYFDSRNIEIVKRE
ncbi:MAG: penicillin-binding protein 2 [Thermodesulfovibrionales bacterium]|nr:penicillin-binding protein 2 [Thermodesulfovibrionales bacterium]